MNVFGGAASEGMMDAGPRGPRGFRGKDGTMNDFVTWLPQTVVNNLQVNDEEGAFFIEDPGRDLIRKKQAITEWVSRSKRGGNFVAKQPSSEIELIEDYYEEDRYAMKFKTTHYYSPELFLLPGASGSCGFMCITFRTYSEKEQVLICSVPSIAPPSPASEIKISGANEITIQIHEVKEIIHHPCKGWTTLFIEYNSDNDLSHFTYDVNGIVGSFTTPIDHGAVESGIHLGCRWDNTNYLDGEITSVEMYENTNTSAPLPDTLKNVVIKNQKIN